MPVVLQKVREEDIPHILDILYAAFDDEPFDRIMFARILAPEARAALTNRLRSEISTDPHLS